MALGLITDICTALSSFCRLVFTCLILMLVWRKVVTSITPFPIFALHCQCVWISFCWLVFTCLILMLVWRKVVTSITPFPIFALHCQCVWISFCWLVFTCLILMLVWRKVAFSVSRLMKQGKVQHKQKLWGHIMLPFSWIPI